MVEYEEPDHIPDFKVGDVVRTSEWGRQYYGGSDTPANEVRANIRNGVVTSTNGTDVVRVYCNDGRISWPTKAAALTYEDHEVNETL